ncbi:MAG: ABC-F family ATP-binding cassette domain-containing protein, partial [Phycisphaerales bacterium]|nr:ABC-F family ATP-binding cassette domain-containing protein [Phycisphaerales bacterium]
DSADRASDLAALKSRNAAAVGDAATVDFAATGRRTRKLIAAHGIGKSFGGRTLFGGLDVELGRGDRLGLLGPNGSGKTTLLRVLTGELAADAGTVVAADPRPRIVVFSQHRQELSPTLPLREALSPTGDFVSFLDQRMHVSGWARRFLFRDDQLNHPVGSLSGGELARLHLARLMLEPADVLVLDEPTNDLDIPTLEVLEEAIEQFPGAAVLVTHDRAMLDRLATQVLALNADGPGRARIFASLDQALAAEAAAKAKAAAAEQDAARTNEARAAAPTPVQRSGRRKLSFNEQREYDGIEQRILEAETRTEAAERRVTDPKVIADHVAMAKACAELEAAHAEVAALYARWQELESRRQ